MLHVTSLNGKYFDLYQLHQLPKSKLTNGTILCLVRFSSGRNKLVQLLIRSRDSGGQTIRALQITIRTLFIFHQTANVTSCIWPTNQQTAIQ